MSVLLSAQFNTVKEAMLWIFFLIRIKNNIPTVVTVGKNTFLIYCKNEDNLDYMLSFYFVS
jgi:hypothetical protein